MDINYKDRLEERNQNAGAVVFVSLFVVAGVFVFSPGELITALAVRTWLQMDRIQIWLVSMAVSFALWSTLRVTCGSKRVNTLYLVCCIVATGLFVLAKFGLHLPIADWIFAVFTQPTETL